MKLTTKDLDEIKKEFDEAGYFLLKCDQCKNYRYVINGRKTDPITNTQWDTMMATKCGCENKLLVIYSSIIEMLLKGLDTTRFTEDELIHLKVHLEHIREEVGDING